jgi:opacity protein-like surface antigen
MNTGRLILFLFLTAGPLSARPALAQYEAEESLGPRPGLSLGGHAAYYRAADAGSGDLMQGAQIRYHLTRRWALEAAAGFLREKSGGVKVDVAPLQFSALIYLMPHGYTVAPYILGGVGWYYTHLYLPEDRSEFRFGPHAGAGVEYFLNTAWSADASARYLWAEDIRTADAAHPLGRSFSGKAYMLALAVNYSF